MELEYQKTLYFRKLAPLKITITSFYYSEKRNIIFAGLSNGSVVAWDMYVPIPLARVMIINAHDGEVTALLYHSQHNLLITGGKDQRIRIWDVIFSPLIDVSGTKKQQLEPFLLKDKFYVKHGGTVMPQEMPSEGQQVAKKSVLIQEFANNQRQVTTIKEQGHGFIVLCEDGTISYYSTGNQFQTAHVLYYQKFNLQSQIGLGYEKNDTLRRTELMDLAAQATRSLLPQSGLIKAELDPKTHSLISNENALNCSKAVPLCCIQTRQDGNIFVGDSQGSVHAFCINQENLRYEYCIGNVHRLGISQMMFLTKENAIVTCGRDGTLRSIVSVTGQPYYSYNDQRTTSFIDICSVVRQSEVLPAAENIASIGTEKQTKQIKTISNKEGDFCGTTSKQYNDTFDAQVLAKSNQNTEKNGKKQATHLLTNGLYNNSGSQTDDQENTFATQSEQKQHILHSIPDTRGINQTNIEALASALDASAMTKNDFLTKFQDNLILAIDEANFISVIDASVGNQIADIDFSDIAPNKVLVQQDFENYKIDSTFPINYDFSLSKNSGLYGILKQQSDENDVKEMIKQHFTKMMNTENEDDGNAHPMLKLFDDNKINRVFTCKNLVCFVRNYCIDIFKPKFKQKQTDQKIQKPVKLLTLLLMSLKVEDFNSKKDEKKTHQQDVFDDKIYLALDAKKVFTQSLAYSNAPRPASPFRDFMQKYRMQKSQLHRINDPLQQLRSISPLLPHDLDSIENFVKNNIDKQGNLPKIESPTRKGIKDNLIKMSVPFYVLMASEDNVINNFDPRVVRKPYHHYSIDFQSICNAEQLDFSYYTKICTQYRQLTILQDGVTKSQKLQVGELPKIQPMPNPNNIYARMTKGTLRNGKEMKSLQLNKTVNSTSNRDNQYRFYHASGYDSNHDLGFYDQDVVYSLVDDGSMKNDIQKMDIETKKVSELPSSDCFCCIVDVDLLTQRDVLIFGHDDGSLTYQNLLTGQMMRVFGCHSSSVIQIIYVEMASAYVIMSISSDSKIFSVQMPKTTSFKISYLAYTKFPYGSLAFVSPAGDQVLLGDSDGNLYITQVPLTDQSHYVKIFSASEFFSVNVDKFPKLQLQNQLVQQSPKSGAKTGKRRFKLGNQDAGEIREKPFCIQAIETRNNIVLLLFENEYCLVFEQMLSDIMQFQQDIASKADAKLFFSTNTTFKSSPLKLAVPNFAYSISQENISVSAVYVCAPLQHGWKLLGQQQNTQNKVLEETLQSSFEERQQSVKEQRATLLNSKYLQQNVNVKLSEFNLARHELVTQEDLLKMGKGIFVIIGYSNGQVNIFNMQGAIIQQYQFDEEITSIVAINRDIIGMKIMNQMAAINGASDLLKTFWVGMADANIDSDICQAFSAE